MKAAMEFHFGEEFQCQMLSLMLRDASFAAKVCKYIPEERLYAEPHKYLFNRIKEKLEAKAELTSYIEIEDHLKTIEPRKRKMLKHFCRRICGSKPDNEKFIKEKLTEYSKKNAFIDVFQTSQTLWNSLQYDDAYTYTMLGINDLYSINYTDDAIIPIEKFEEERQFMINEMSKGTRRVPTNIGPLDDILRGGLERGELGIVLAEPKRGKSICLTHMGATAVMMRMGRVAHFVLEGTKEQAILRYLSRISGIEYHRLEKDEITLEESKLLDAVSKKYMRKLDLIPFNQHWSYTVLDIEAKLKELINAGRKPDLVVIDYADLLKSGQKLKELRHDQAEVYRDLKRLAVMQKFAIWTASQATRPKDTKEKGEVLRSKDIAESYEKVRIADLVMTLNQTLEEKKDGVLRLHVDIYRSNDTEKTIHLLTNFEKMIFYSKVYGHADPTIDTKFDWMKEGRRGKKKMT